MAPSRRFGFHGSDAHYIAFLEEKLIESLSIIHVYRRSLPSQGFHKAATRDAPLENGCPSLSRRNEDDDGDLQIIEYKYQSHAKSITPKPPRWRTQLHDLLAKVPPLARWDHERSKIPADNDTILKIAVGLGEDPTERFPKLSLPLSVNALGVTSALREYRSFTQGVLRRANGLQNVAWFLELVFFSLCAVALKTAEDRGPIYEEVGHYSSSTDNRYLDKLIDGAIWANRCVSALSETYWSNRSQELFLVAGQSVSFFRRYAENSTSMQEFLKGMTDKSCGGSYSSGSPPILFMPLILEQIIGDSVPFPDICKHLGYSHVSLSKCRPYVKQVLHPATHGSIQTNKRRQPESFWSAKRPRMALIPHNRGQYDTTSVSPSTPHQQMHCTSGTSTEPNAQEYTDPTVPFYAPGLYDTTSVFPSTPYQPVHSTSGTSNDHNAECIDATVPSYVPGLYDTTSVFPSTPYQPVQSARGTNNAEEYMDAVNFYGPGLYDTSSMCPNSPYHPLHLTNYTSTSQNAPESMDADYSYGPGSDGTSTAFLSTPYQPVQSTGDINRFSEGLPCFRAFPVFTAGQSA